MRVAAVSWLFAAAAVGQANWLPQSPASPPAGRYGHSLVYDPGSQRTFALWGMLNTGLPSGTCHMWDGTNWSQCAINTGGAFLLIGRDGALSPDLNGGLLMFGGWRPGVGIGGGMPTALDQTWSILTSASGSLQFTLLAPTVHPSARCGAAMVRTNQGVLLFGGSAVSGSPQYGDTWLWNGATWAPVSLGGPGARVNAAMAFDSVRNVAVLFGGAGLGDTWEFDGVAWHAKAPANTPSARARAGFAFDPALGRCVLFGGAQVGGSVLNDTWTWDGTDWQFLYSLTAPPPRQGGALTYDPVRQQVLSFGGVDGINYYNDTQYVDVQSSPSSFTPFGAGCAGPTAQVPTLTVPVGEVPHLGATCHLTIGNLPSGALTLPVFVFGASNTFEPSSSHALPFDLSFLGWPGCQQLVSHDVMLATPTLATQVIHTLTVPWAMALIGYTFHAQAFVLYTPSGAAVSNALTGVVGT